MKTWRELITQRMQESGDSWNDIISCTLSEEELDQKFNNGYGGSEGKPFTLWTVNNVYFPVVYDGAEWCGFVARNPDGRPTAHYGGE